MCEEEQRGGRRKEGRNEEKTAAPVTGMQLLLTEALDDEKKVMRITAETRPPHDHAITSSPVKL